MRKPVSLRAQAVAWLAQREHSVREIRGKLMRRLQSRAAADARAGTDRVPRADESGETNAPESSHQAQVDEVITWLLQRGYLDEERFVASRVNVRSARFGISRIAQELAQHGLELPAETSQDLRASELERASSIWQRRFGAPAVDAREAARQARFLAGRGFSGDVIRRILRAAGRPAKDDHESA